MKEGGAGVREWDVIVQCVKMRSASFVPLNHLIVECLVHTVNVWCDDVFVTRASRYCDHHHGA